MSAREMTNDELATAIDGIVASSLFRQTNDLFTEAAARLRNAHRERGTARVPEKVYTARKMREMANKEKFKCSFVTRTLNGGIILDCTSDVRAMLRQAAETRERCEKVRTILNSNKDDYESRKLTGGLVAINKEEIAFLDFIEKGVIKE